MMMISQLQAQAPSPPVLVQAYTETLCIDCQRFVSEHLIPTYTKLGPEVMKLELIPFGNADVDESRKTVVCQHGDAECDANLWEQSAFQLYPETAKQLSFLGCLEDALPMGTRKEPFETGPFSDCAEVAGMDFAAIQNLHDDPLVAWMLQKKASAATPSHDHVPWIMINGKYMDEEKYNFMEVVCEAFTSEGSKHPSCPTDA